MRPEFIYLASLSPRRRQLLGQIGVYFQVLDINIDESAGASEAPLAYVTRLAAAKAGAGLSQSEVRGSPAQPVLAADTAVVIDGEILGKPRDGEEGQRMLRLLSGRTHEVLTAVALATSGGIESRVSRSEVTFGAIGAAQARGYWDTGEPCDKAGGYAIQGYGAVFVSGLRGSYSGVMGLPLYETAELLRSAGVSLWRPGMPGGGDEH